MNRLRMFVTACLLVGLMATNSVLAADFSTVKAKLDTAMQASVRGDKDTQRDANRRPAATLEFFGLRDNMTVIELIPGGGWYTKLLAPILAANGKLYEALGTAGIENNLLLKKGFEKKFVIQKETCYWYEKH